MTRKRVCTLIPLALALKRIIARVVDSDIGVRNREDLPWEAGKSGTRSTPLILAGVAGALLFVMLFVITATETLPRQSRGGAEII